MSDTIKDFVPSATNYIIDSFMFQEFEDYQQILAALGDISQAVGPLSMPHDVFLDRINSFYSTDRKFKSFVKESLELNWAYIGSGTFMKGSKKPLSKPLLEDMINHLNSPVGFYLFKDGSYNYDELNSALKDVVYPLPKSVLLYISSGYANGLRLENNPIDSKTAEIRFFVNLNNKK